MLAASSNNTAKLKIIVRGFTMNQKITQVFICLIVMFSAKVDATKVNEINSAESISKEGKNMTTNELFQTLIGKWQGSVRTWFEPGKLADESTVVGEFEELLGGKFVRHSYTGSMQGKPRTGEETLAINSVTKEIEISWFDSFHMNYALLFSRGKANENGFSVFSKYDVAVGTPQWGWRTEFILIDADHLTIIAYNVTPEGEESKGVEINYQRVK